MLFDNTNKSINSVDVNECDLGQDNCDADATCANTIGSFTCTCNEGYTGSGVNCNGKGYLEKQSKEDDHRSFEFFTLTF